MSQRSEETSQFSCKDGFLQPWSHEKSPQIFSLHFSRIWQVLDRFRSVGIARQQDQRMTVVMSGHAYLPRQFEETCKRSINSIRGASCINQNISLLRNRQDEHV